MAPLSPAQQKFILHWGTMGTQWGINRTVAQIHALLFISPGPLPAEEIAETLQVARSNVSNSLRELQGWGIIRTISVIGDRRDHFESLRDVWELFRIVFEERKRREFDPTLALLRECLAETEKNKSDAFTHERLSRLLEFFETTGGWFEQLRKLPNSAIIKFIRLGDKLFKKLGISS
jgi:DNA-binding transcriptional regulator GbsR (MarR family)